MSPKNSIFISNTPIVFSPVPAPVRGVLGGAAGRRPRQWAGRGGGAEEGAAAEPQAERDGDRGGAAAHHRIPRVRRLPAPLRRRVGAPHPDPDQAVDPPRPLPQPRPLAVCIVRCDPLVSCQYSQALPHPHLHRIKGNSSHSSAITIITYSN